MTDGQKCGKESVGQTGGRFSRYSYGILFSYYVTFVWSCNVALWDISLYLVKWRTCVVIRLVRPIRPCSAPPAYSFTNNAVLILPPEADQRRSKISPLSSSETFTQRRVQRIGAGSPYANGSVSWASAIGEYTVQVMELCIVDERQRRL